MCHMSFKPRILHFKFYEKSRLEKGGMWRLHLALITACTFPVSCTFLLCLISAPATSFEYTHFACQDLLSYSRRSIPWRRSESGSTWGSGRSSPWLRASKNLNSSSSRERETPIGKRIASDDRRNRRRRGSVDVRDKRQGIVRDADWTNEEDRRRCEGQEERRQRRPSVGRRRGTHRDRWDTRDSYQTWSGYVFGRPDPSDVRAQSGHLFHLFPFGQVHLGRPESTSSPWLSPSWTAKFTQSQSEVLSTDGQRSRAARETNPYGSNSEVFRSRPAILVARSRENPYWSNLDLTAT